MDHRRSCSFALYFKEIKIIIKNRNILCNVVERNKSKISSRKKNCRFHYQSGASNSFHNNSSFLIDRQVNIKLHLDALRAEIEDFVIVCSSLLPLNTLPVQYVFYE